MREKKKHQLMKGQPLCSSPILSNNVLLFWWWWCGNGHDGGVVMVMMMVVAVVVVHVCSYTHSHATAHIWSDNSLWKSVLSSHSTGS